MSSAYESALIEIFIQLNKKNFRVDLSERFLFLCGGLVDPKLSIPPSFRDRLLTYTASNEQDIHDSFVLAEKFKDYFKENAYPDLVMFEDEIANLSSLVIILLESPGSLVELGMFCTKPSVYKKLIIVAPQEKTEDEDSFIYLGPLEYIKKKYPSSVAIYPWPSPEENEYDQDNLSDLCDVINNKLKELSKTEQFNSGNSGHIALLIYEIISLCYPILISDIELALAAMDIEIPESTIARHLYLLAKVNLIDQLLYSNFRYYFPCAEGYKKIKFGKTKQNQILDAPKVRMSINSSFVLADDSLSRKRRNALKQISKKNSEGSL